MSEPEAQAIQLMNEKKWEAAVAEWRRLAKSHPSEGKYQKKLGETLYLMGEQRFLKEDNLQIGAPALFESIRYHASVWYESRYEDQIKALAGNSLERQGGIRHFIKIAHNENNYHGAGMAFMVAQWTPWIAGVPRIELDERENELRIIRRDKPSDLLPELELAAVHLLSGKLDEAANHFAAIKQSGKKLPIAIDLDAFIQFCTLISPDESVWQKVPIGEIGDWRQAGFSAWEATVWSQHFSTVESAFPWWQQGFSVPESVLWTSNGVDICNVAAWRQSKIPVNQIAKWQKAQVSPEDVALWRRSGTRPDMVAEWVKAGFSVKDVLKLQNNIWKKFTPPEAKTWREQGIDSISDIFEWFSKRIVDPMEAGRRLRAGQTPDAIADELSVEVREAWQAVNFDRTESALWQPLGIEPAESRRWRDRGFGPEQAQVWIRSRVKPDVAQKWKHTGLSPLAIFTYDQDGLTPSLYKHFENARERNEWKSLSIPWEQAVAFKRIKVDPSKAKAWLDAGCEASEVQYLEQNKITPENIIMWRSHGFDKPQDIVNWGRFGLIAGKAADWRNIGCNDPNLAGRMAEAGMKPAEARLWLAHNVPLVTAEYYAKVGLDAKTGLSLRADNPQADRIVRAIASVRIGSLGEWLATGFPLSQEITQWAQAKWPPKDAYPWWKYFCRPETAARLKSKGVNPDEILPWHRGQPDWERQLPDILQAYDDKEAIIIAWVNDFYRETSEFSTLEEAVPWIAAWCFENGYLAAAWKREGYDIETARRWTAVEYPNPKWVTNAILEGITLESLEKKR